MDEFSFFCVGISQWIETNQFEEEIGNLLPAVESRSQTSFSGSGV